MCIELGFRPQERVVAALRRQYLETRSFAMLGGLMRTAISCGMMAKADCADDLKSGIVLLPKQHDKHPRTLGLAG